ncbi:MAG: hypothetical protein H0W73_08740 [Bacteroidetes bacterium]|nr:hypothetical protein [Bacteroidota bacterium]
MKNILIIIATIFNIGAFAQDTLYTTKGRIITGQVIEITPQEIKYKRAANPDGPLYVVDKTDIVLIHYKNGSKDVFENSSTISPDNSQNNSNDNTVVVDNRPRVSVVVGTPLPYIAWGALGWGWNRPFYHRSYNRGFWGGGHHHHHGHHGHYGHRR